MIQYDMTGMQEGWEFNKTTCTLSFH